MNARRLAALQALADRGATPGERAAARAALLAHGRPRPAPAPAAAPAPPAPPAGDDRCAQPFLLDSGAWGVIVRWGVAPGEVVTVRARDGRTWPARIVSIEWQRNGATACSVANVDDERPNTRHWRGMTYSELRDLLIVLAGSHALRLAQVEMQGMDRKQRRRHLDTLISGITGRPPSPT